MTTPTQTAKPSLPPGLQVASMLAWVWGVLFSLSTLAVAIPAIAQNGLFSGAALFVLLLAVLAAGLCYAGYGLRKRRRSAGWVALVIGAFLILVPIAYRAPITKVGILVNILIVALTIRNWRSLSKRSDSAGA